MERLSTRSKETRRHFSTGATTSAPIMRRSLIGVVKLIYRGDVASILTFLPKTSHHDKRPANAIMAKAVELCAEKRINHLIFGKFNYGNKQAYSFTGIQDSKRVRGDTGAALLRAFDRERSDQCEAEAASRSSRTLAPQA